MTPKEGAKKLFNKMFEKIEDTTAGMFEEDIPYLDIRYRTAKQCALIAVGEILNIDNIKPYIIHKEIIEFYQEVKQQIELL